MTPKLKSGRWPHRWLCALLNHDFKPSHSLIHWAFCARCGKATRIKSDPFSRRKARRAAEQRARAAAAGARRMGFDAPKGAA